jgi:hypothetical protein
MRKQAERLTSNRELFFAITFISPGRCYNPRAKAGRQLHGGFCRARPGAGFISRQGLPAPGYVDAHPCGWHPENSIHKNRCFNSADGLQVASSLPRASHGRTRVDIRQHAHAALSPPPKLPESVIGSSGFYLLQYIYFNGTYPRKKFAVYSTRG